MGIAEILVSYIRNGVTNYKTNQPFKKEDIKDEAIKSQVENLLNPQ